MKEHILRDLVNELRDIAIQYHGHDCLRQLILVCVTKHQALAQEWEVVAETRKEREQIIDKLRSPAGGWSRDSLEILGVKWPPKKGWRKKIIAGENPNI